MFVSCYEIERELQHTLAVTKFFSLIDDDGRIIEVFKATAGSHLSETAFIFLFTGKKPQIHVGPGAFVTTADDDDKLFFEMAQIIPGRKWSVWSEAQGSLGISEAKCSDDRSNSAKKKLFMPIKTLYILLYITTFYIFRGSIKWKNLWM